MKRFLLIIIAILLGLAARAQSVTYTCRYWFDMNHAQAVTSTFGESGWEAEIDVGSLTEGIHSLHLHVMDTSMKWSAPQSYLFLKLTPPASSSDFTYYYWFDQDHASMQNGALGDGHLLLDVDALNTGMHSLHIMVKGTEYTSSQSYLFFKTDMAGQGGDNYVYHYWFDQDFEHQQSDALVTSHLLLDVADLEDGIHTLNVMLQGSTLTATQSYMFMKMAVEDPSTELQYTCWFDQDYGSAQTGLLGSGLFELEVGDLPNGIHTVNVQLSNGTRTAPQCYLFYKQPLGGYGIARWEYWLNDDIANRQITNISPTVDTLDIISLLNVGHPALRSSCFHFHPNGDAPYINAKNQINFRFYDSELRLIDKSAYYVDEQVQQDIVATVFERNTTETFAAPRDNQIRWFKINAESGEYLSFCADKTCTMQLFSPSGEEIYSVLGPESILLEGFNVWEDGSYYLAVHDVMGSSETISVTYNWLNRYAVVSYDVHQVGNGGCSTITFQGNGFNSLLDAYLVNAQNDTIRSLDIGHESNTATTVTFNFYQVNLGVYDAVFQFYGETIRINGAIEVQEPVDIVLTNSVSYPSSFLSGTPVTYTYTVTNNGNMSAYAIPVFVYISTLTSGSVSRIKMEGFNLPSIIDERDLDTLSEMETTNLKEYADLIGDTHHFFNFKTIDEETADSINLWSNFFFINVAPFETKTLSITITATTTIGHRPLQVWMTITNDTVQPLTLMNDRGSRGYCCVADGVSCVVDMVCEYFNIADALSIFFPGTPVPAISGTASCICGAASTLLGTINYWVCDEHPNFPGFLWDVANSVVGTVASCVDRFIPGIAEAERINKLRSLISAISGGLQEHWDCFDYFNNKNPNCLPGKRKGGVSDMKTSNDPNDIRGYLSESGSHYMRQEIQNVQYEIEFENDTTLATAAAHTIIVRDTLDATKFDLNSLAARSVTIGDKRLELNGEQTFARTLDLRPEIYVIAQIEQDYDPATGIVEWTIQSLDPMTMEPIDDPNQGVLPVNYNGNGVGFIDYSINLKEAFADGTEISNRAGIIFDQEDIIMTPTWTNIVDAVKPTSHIEEVTFEDDTLNFSFISSDNRSGVWYHTLYYRNDSTYQEWQVKVPRIFENSYMLRFKEYQTTEYLVMAVDSAGNVEDKEMVAEYIHYYNGPIPLSHTIELSQGWNWWSTDLNITLNDLKAALEATETPAITIKSKTQNIYYQNGMWRGSLDFDVAMMYKVYVGAACEITLEGLSIDPSEHPIIIHYGPNWIGFPFGESMTLDAAFAGFAVNGDVIKHKGGSANYLNGHWRGAFNLEPGKGYIYRSNQSSDRILTFPSSGK